MARKKAVEPWRDDALEAVRTLRAGGVILHASDTVWGLACDASNSDAIAKLRSLKGRDEGTPILVIASDDGMIQNHVESVPEAAWDLYDAADRPTTIVLPGGRGVDSSILGPGGSLAVRRINEPWCEFVIRGLGKPIASSSANLSGVPTPKSFSDIDSSIAVGVDFVSSHRKSEVLNTPPSFMVSFDTEGRFKILRK
ncbi:MAG: Sua5/YciO/YrdC/YwlC family protein [Bacteroidota bacterium]|nr:Sua5/YciO/YrdC/YwlC family protein [Bacteroidota bacterium]